MRRTLTVCRRGLSVAAAVVLLTACGGSDEEESASSETSASNSSATETSAAQADSEFCTEAAGIEDRVSSSFNQSDPAALGQALRDAASEIQDIEPPDEIASDWAALAAGVEEIAGIVETTDPDDPAAQESAGAQLQQLQVDLQSASTNVETYLSEECGIDTSGSEPSAPTS
jgi:hypothetical protein